MGAADSQYAQAIVSRQPTGPEIATGTPHDGTGEGSHGQARDALRGPQLDPRSVGAQLVLSLWVGLRLGIEVERHYTECRFRLRKHD